MPDVSTDDGLTLIAVGVLAFIVADVTHEGLGHGIATLAVGGKAVILTSSYFGSSGSVSRWIPAAGGLANIVAGFLAWLALRLWKGMGAQARYFFALLIAFNWLFAAAYPAYSGVAGFGDWAAVIAGLSPGWLWRMLLVVISVTCYYLSLRVIAAEMSPFGTPGTPQALERLRRTTLIPYLAALAVAGLAGAFNPRGWVNIFTAALPAAAGTFGVTQIDHFLAGEKDSSTTGAGAIRRSIGWIGAAAIVSVFFVGVLGPGIRFDPR